VVISMVSNALIAQSAVELEQLLKYLPKHMTVCIGGSAAEMLAANVKDARVSVCKDYQGYEEVLDAHLTKVRG